MNRISGHPEPHIPLASLKPQGFHLVLLLTFYMVMGRMSSNAFNVDNLKVEERITESS